MVFWNILLFVLAIGHSQCVKESVYTKNVICNTEERVTTRCSSGITGVSSLIQCIDMCKSEDSCLGFNLDERGTCFRHTIPCPSTNPCSERDDRLINIWMRYCVSGIWDSSTWSCKCIGGSYGQRCDRYNPQNCDSLIAAGLPKGHHKLTIDPFQDGINIISVLCYINPDHNYYNVKVFSNKGGIDFNRTYTEYVDGFHEDDLNLWLGLRPLVLLNNAGCTDVILHLISKQGRSYYCAHNKFYINNQDEKFTFTASNVHGGGNSMCECLESLQNTPFSTWDNDNDGDADVNCASRAGSGWWYPGCHNPCNVLGWGLDNWQDTPQPQRLSVLGIDVYGVAPTIVEAYLKCPPTI